jgi:hypothetical protein
MMDLKLGYIFVFTDLVKSEPGNNFMTTYDII